MRSSAKAVLQSTAARDRQTCKEVFSFFGGGRQRRNAIDRVPRRYQFARLYTRTTKNIGGVKQYGIANTQSSESLSPSPRGMRRIIILGSRTHPAKHVLLGWVKFGNFFTSLRMEGDWFIVISGLAKAGADQNASSHKTKTAPSRTLGVLMLVTKSSSFQARSRISHRPSTQAS